LRRVIQEGAGQSPLGFLLQLRSQSGCALATVREAESAAAAHRQARLVERSCQRLQQHRNRIAEEEGRPEAQRLQTSVRSTVTAIAGCFILDQR
jgi:hypothetical protein